MRIKDTSRERYSSLALNSVWNLELVRQATALIIGAGALGNEVAKNLAMMGVRALILVDRDTVEVANLTRSVFYREADHGRLKVDVLAERLTELNPDTHILPINGELGAVVGLGLIRRVDMIFSCLDNRLARKTINRLCQKMGRAWVDGSMENLLGDVTVFHPDQGPCYECTLSNAEQSLISLTVPCKGVAIRNVQLGKVPTISTMGSIIGALQAQEGLKLLHGQSKWSLAGSRMVVNCLTNDFYLTGYDYKEECQGHFRFGEAVEVPQWTSARTTPRDILARFQTDMGDDGHLVLGRDIVIGLDCSACKTHEDVVGLLSLLRFEKALCPECQALRDPKTINVIRGHDPQVDWTLEQLRLPPLEVLEVRGGSGQAWYEMTGDLQAYTRGLLQ